MPSRSELRDAVLRGLYRGGWRVAARIPYPWLRPAFGVVAGVVASRGRGHVATLRRNLAALTGAPVPGDVLRAAVVSYLRAFYEVLALPGWSAAEVRARVRTLDEHLLRDAYAGPGAVVALPHSGNWDLAGAWACATGMPVTTVAERLGAAEFAAFVAFREQLGMEVLPHDDPAAISRLAAAVRAGRLVCLLADRDLPGHGLAVDWAGQAVTMPAGAAVVARRTGAALIPAVCRYEGDQMVIVFGPPVPPRPGRAGLVAMTQQVADFFASTLARRPEDWHMMQPFFDAAPAR